jgi:hypothetical protein
MNDGTSDRHGPLGLRRAAAVAVAATALLMAACSGGGSSPSSAGPPGLTTLTAQALAYAKCMRSRGITNFPDPFENSHQIGFNLTGTGIDQNSPRFKAANKTCQPLMPGGGP